MSEIKSKNIISPAGIIEVPYSEKVDYGTFSKVFDKKSASYKPLWFRGILDEVFLGHNTISFKTLQARMIKYAWYPIVVCKLNFGVCDSLQKIINYILNKYDTIDDKNIIEFILNTTDMELIKKMRNLINDVPHRFLSPFYVLDSNEKKNLKENLEKFSVYDCNSIYQIKIDNNGEKYIIVRDKWFQYFKDNYKILKEWSLYKLSEFLQQKNPNVPGVSFKLEPPQFRNLALQTKIWKNILKDNKVIDIYTNLEICNNNCEEYGTLSLDHYIPWSFVYHDQIWNLIPTFKNINSMKSDKLMNYNKYIDGVCNLQFLCYKYMYNLENKNKYKNQKEEYIDLFKINNPEELAENKNREEFNRRYKDAVYPIYNIAKNQGFKVVDYLK